jgi:hypothetical protein
LPFEDFPASEAEFRTPGYAAFTEKSRRLAFSKRYDHSAHYAAFKLQQDDLASAIGRPYPC